MKRIKSVRTLLLGLALVLVMCVCGVTLAAAVTSTPTEKRANAITVGNVIVEVDEPGWDENTPADVICYPNREIIKDPSAANKGNTDAWLFMEVWIPVRTVQIAPTPPNVTLTPAALHELFSYTVSNSSWIYLSAYDRTEVLNGEQYNVHVYGYDKIVKPGGKTPNLFEKVKFLNMLEGSLPQGTRVEMPIKAIAIQSEFLNEVGATTAAKLADIFGKYLAIPEKEEGSVPWTKHEGA
jgi:hypothetical protein